METGDEGAGRVPKTENRLINEKSPYLLQHAHNPVDWYPWGDEAFRRAKEEDRPIFLSIGYSTCHWCHVMERESFEDVETARLMNDAFVCIKVDREERPDIDGIYMEACRLMTGSGGWPLTIIMTPDRQPFFAATYIPRENRFGRRGMVTLIPEIDRLWKEKRDDVHGAAAKILDALRRGQESAGGGELSSAHLDRAFEQLRSIFDAERGGFGRSPKFPTPHNLFFLLRYWKRTGSADALRMVEKTLLSMRRGGMWDHVGFGFHRYSTDAEWLVPHFEKMLYDQALLAMACTEAFQAGGDDFFARTAHEIFTYVLRDMTAPQGGFYSAEDADSEGSEGRFYLWSLGEIKETLGEEDARLFAGVFNIRREGNYLDEATGEMTAVNIPHLTDKAAEVPEERLDTIRRRLFERREQRVRPLRDDKILVDWNGLMIAALARAGTAFGDDRLTCAAEAAAGFILTTMRDAEGRLFHRYREGEAGLPPCADDYAFFIWGLLELYEATFETRYLGEAIALQKIMDDDFLDHEEGGFFFAPSGADDLILRVKESYDGAVPSANSVSMLNLLRLARFTGRALYDERAAGVARAFGGSVAGSPAAHTQFLVAVDFALGDAIEVVIAGREGARDTIEMIEEVRAGFRPSKVVLFRPEGERVPPICTVAPFTTELRAIDGKATAYVCHAGECALPVSGKAAMKDCLDKAGKK
jgi:uncharacterized protein